MGVLDDPIRQLVEDMVGLFSETALSVTKRTRSYDAATDAETTSDRTVEVQFTPPVNVSLRNLSNLQGGGSPEILASDLEIYAPAKAFDELVPPFDPTPDSESSVWVVLDGIKYSVTIAREVWSGDRRAMYQLFLRR